MSWEKWSKWQLYARPTLAQNADIMCNNLSLSYFWMTDMLTTNNPVYSSPAISAALPSSPQHPSPAAMPPSPVWACPAGYAIPPVAGCACMQDGVHAHHPDSAGTCMLTAQPEDWHKKHKNVLSKLSQRRNSSSSRITILQNIAHRKFQSQNWGKWRWTRIILLENKFT